MRNWGVSCHVSTCGIINLASTFVVAIGINLIIAVLTGVGIFALNSDTMGLNGSLVYGFSLGMSGLCYAAITALFAQVFETNLGVVGFSFTFMIVSYLVRAAGDLGSEALSYLSPMGVAYRTYPYYKNNWLMIILLVLISLVFAGVALYLNSVRDHGAGLVASKPGRTHATRFCKVPWVWCLEYQEPPLLHGLLVFMRRFLWFSVG